MSHRGDVIVFLLLTVLTIFNNVSTNNQSEAQEKHIKGHDNYTLRYYENIQPYFNDYETGQIVMEAALEQYEDKINARNAYKVIQENNVAVEQIDDKTEILIDVIIGETICEIGLDDLSEREKCALSGKEQKSCVFIVTINFGDTSMKDDCKYMYLSNDIY